MEVIATYFMEKFNTNLLIIMDDKSNYHVVTVIEDQIYVGKKTPNCIKENINKDTTINIEMIKGSIRNYYYYHVKIIDSTLMKQVLYNHFTYIVNDELKDIYKFAKDNMELFEPNTNYILK